MMNIASHSNKANLKAIIDTSDLVINQKDAWHAFIRDAADREVEMIMLALQDDASFLSYLTNNLIQKIEAMSKKDSSLWRKIIEDEKTHLKNIK